MIRDKYLLSEKKVNSSKVKQAVDEAESAFWATISDFLGDADTEEFKSGDAKELRKAMEKAVSVWVKNNTFD